MHIQGRTVSPLQLITQIHPLTIYYKPTGTYSNQSVVVTLTYDEAVTGLTTDTSQFSEAI